MSLSVWHASGSLEVMMLEVGEGHGGVEEFRVEVGFGFALLGHGGLATLGGGRSGGGGGGGGLILHGVRVYSAEVVGAFGECE